MQQAKPTVTIRMTLECGRCGNRTVRELKTTSDGLLEIPTLHCGQCIKSKVTVPMTTTWSEGKIIDPTESEVKPAVKEEQVIDADGFKHMKGAVIDGKKTTEAPRQK